MSRIASRENTHSYHHLMPKDPNALYWRTEFKIELIIRKKPEAERVIIQPLITLTLPMNKG